MRSASPRRSTRARQALRALIGAVAAVALLSLGGCGPKILEKRAVSKPDPKALRPTPSPEEVSGEVPPLRDLLPPVAITPAEYALSEPPDDPRPTLPDTAPAPAENLDAADPDAADPDAASPDAANPNAANPAEAAPADDDPADSWAPNDDPPADDPAPADGDAPADDGEAPTDPPS